MAKNEKTGARVAKIAGQILRAECVHPLVIRQGSHKLIAFESADIRALAASALTQAPDRKKEMNPVVPAIFGYLVGFLIGGGVCFLFWVFNRPGDIAPMTMRDPPRDKFEM